MIHWPMRIRRYLDLLRRNRAFSRLFSAQLISFAGDRDLAS
jgi:hypothetical protein